MGRAANHYLGEFEQAVLFALLRLGRNAYGVTIRKEIEERTGRSVAIGAVYTTLDRLAKKGHVSSRVGPPTPERGGRRKKFYQLEPRGTEALTQAYEVLQRMTKGLKPKLEAL